jgi:hypothetical protein
MYTIVLESPELSVTVVVTVGCGGMIKSGTVVLIESDCCGPDFAAEVLTELPFKPLVGPPGGRVYVGVGQ